MPGRIQNLVAAGMKRQTNLLLLRGNERLHDQMKNKEKETRGSYVCEFLFSRSNALPFAKTFEGFQVRLATYAQPVAFVSQEIAEAPKD